MSRSQDCQRVRGVDSHHITVAGDVLQHDDNIYENTAFSQNQEIYRSNTQSSKKKLSKLQIAVIVAIILNFALAAGTLAITLLKGNEISDRHQKLESKHNVIESSIKDARQKLNENITLEEEREIRNHESYQEMLEAMEKQLSQLQGENTELKKNLSVIELRLSRLEDRNTPIKRNLTTMESRFTRLEDENTEIYSNATTQLTMIRNAQSGVNIYLLARINGMNSSANVSNKIIRLVDGGTNYGRVEIFYNSEWGTVCDDAWDDIDATVVCRMLGYLGPATAHQEANYGEGTGQIWLDDVSCRGNEIAIWNCGGNLWGSHDCRHSEDASVYCEK